MNTKLLSTVIGITLLASPIIAIAQIDTGDTTTSTTGIISTLEHLLVSLTAELNALLASRPTSPDGQLATAIIGTVATPSQVPAFPTTRTAFFTDLYQCILGRAPDAGGLAYWVAQPSTMTLGSIYQTWFTSPEYLSRATSNQTFMTQVYNCILFRQADLNGYNGWVKGLQSGATRSAVVRSSVSSSEFLTSQGPKLSTATGFTLSTTTMSIAKPTTSITADNTNITVGQSTSIHASFTAGSGDTVTTTAINQPYGTTVVGGGSVWGTPLVNPLSYTFKPTAPGTYNFYSFVQTKSYPSWYAVTPATVTVNVSTTSSRNIPFAYYYSEQNVAAAAGIANTVLVTAKYDDVIKGSPYVLNELAQAKSHDLDVIIIISDIFFNSDYSLRSGGNIAFSQLWNSIQSYKSSVRGFYLPDEPFSQLYNMRANGKSTVTYMQLSQYLDTISAYIHTTVASIPTILIFAQGDVGLSNFYNTYLPRSVDWIGYDCYLSNGCTDQTVESALDMMVQSKAANQKIVIVPDANWTSVPNDLIDSQVASRVQLYENWYATHQSQVAAVLPFSFGGTIAVNGWVGIGSGSLPKTTAELLHFFTDTSLSTSSPVPTISMSASAASVAVGTPITITANFIPGLGDAVVVDAINEIPPSGVQFTPVYTGTGGVVLKNPLSYTFTTTTPGTYVFKPEVMTSKYPAWTTSDPSQWITVIVHQATIDSRISVANASGLYPDWGAADLVKSSQDVLSLGFSSMEIYLSPEVCWNGPGYHRTYGIYETLDWCRTQDAYAGYGALKGSISELAQNPRYKAAFALPFKTFILTTEANSYTTAPFYLSIASAAFTQAQYDAIYKEYFDLAAYLDTTYKNTGKTFIIQTPNEMDWEMIGSGDATGKPNAVAVKNAINYWNQIQNAINDARRLVPPVGMHVYGGCELNLVQKGMASSTAITAVNSVLPSTYCDLYGYSSWDTITPNPTIAHASDITKALDYIASKAPASVAFGHKNVYISEIGLAESQYATASGSVVAAYAQQALNWGVPYVNLWAMYDNDCSAYLPTNAQCPGYWMRKPDMTLSYLYQAVLSAFGR